MRLIAGLLIAAFLALPAKAQEAPIQGTIRSQLDAFQADDFARAFTFASPIIQRLFGSAENFGAMVKQGYPMVHRPGSVKMLDLRTQDSALWQKVMITDAQGRTHILDYEMVETADGWQINGVRLLPDPGVGA